MVFVEYNWDDVMSTAMNILLSTPLTNHIIQLLTSVIVCATYYPEYQSSLSMMSCIIAKNSIVHTYLWPWAEARRQAVDIPIWNDTSPGLAKKVHYEHMSDVKFSLSTSVPFTLNIFL